MRASKGRQDRSTAKRNRSALAVLVLALGGLAPVVSSAAADVEVRVLSNRADLLSGADALVEVILPEHTDPAGLTVDVDGRDVSADFAVRTNGRIIGLVSELSVGANVLTARLGDAGPGARITLTNHPIGGPVFSGPQLQPWICTTQAAQLGPPIDGQCNAPTRVDYFYRPAGGSGWSAYNPQNPPPDNQIARTTTDQGETVPYVIRQETGTQNRGIYRVAVLYDPAQPWSPWAPQRGWNGKLYYPFGASCGTQYTQGSAQEVRNDMALSRGFMVATSSLNVLGNNCNTVLSAETMMMLKEHIIERYGEIRYTFGTGVSGGSIGQHMVANSYPGLLQGITTGLAYADTTSTGAEVFDCHLLLNYFARTSPHLWANPAQQSAVSGHGTSPATCAGWEALFASVLDPKTGCGPVPAAQVYHPQTNPGGARCTYQDFERNVYGLRSNDLWIAPEQTIGRGFAKGLYDNIGVQFGLGALQEGLITPEQFVDLNEKIGGFDIDFEFTSERRASDPGTAATLYRSGRLNDATQLDSVALIDTRPIGNVDAFLIHTMHHSFALKERIAKAHGTAENHVVWRGGSPGSHSPGVPLATPPEAFLLMDEWLSGVEADASAEPLAEKIRRHRPADATDACFVAGQRIEDKDTCDVVWPYYGAPRIVAGAPTTHDILKCQLRPLDRTDDYGPVPFTEAQWTRLEAVFASGVCDWSAPSVGHTTSVPWLSYAAGAVGTPLGAAPASVPL